MSRLYESIFRNVLYPAYESGFRHRGTLGYVREYERTQWLSEEQVLELQWAKLKRLLDFCWDSIPYYREQWRGMGISPADINTREDYARLPVLGKQEIRENFERLMPLRGRGDILFKTTGGSTGEPLRFGYTRESYERRIAVMFRGYGWVGARLGQRTLYLWGQPSGPVNWKDRMYQAAFHRRTLNAFTMSDARMAEYADAIDAYRPEVVVSYVTPIVRMAEWLLANGRRCHRPRVILGAAESLHESQREIVERAFGCGIHNTYGCREFMLIAAECEYRSGLHVNADHLMVELGDGGSDAAPRDIIVTDLHNYGMPLLRYANGDLARPGGRCACGRGLPLLASVDGRRLDALRTRDGKYLPGEFIVYTFLAATGIRQYQVVQNELDALDVNIVPGEGYDASVVAFLEGQLRKGFGDGTSIRFHLRDDIPLTPSGKRRVTVNNLA